MDSKRPAFPAWTRLDALAVVALLGTTILVALYVMVDSRAAFHSDSALKSVLAAVALDEHSLIPDGWTFANGDTMIATPYTLLVPIQAFFGISFSTNSMATLLCFLAMLIATYYLARTICPDSRTPALTACALAACTLSSANLEFLAAQGAYSLYAALALPLFALLLRPSAGIEKWAPTLLAFALAVNNPARAWVGVFVPAILAMLASSLSTTLNEHTDLRSRLTRLASPPFVLLLTGAVSGHLVYTLAVVPSMQNFDAAARLTPASVEHMLFVSKQLPNDWFTYFQIGGAWSSLSIAGRTLQMGVWLVASSVLFAPALVLLSTRYPKEMKCAAWLTLGLLASGLTPLVLLDGLYQGPMEVRYATLGILVGLALVPAVAHQLFGEQRRRFFTATICFLLSISLATSWAWQLKVDPDTPDSRGVSLQQRMALLDALRERQVGSAVATYWNSHVLSVLSSGKTIVSPVSYNDRLAPFAHHSPNAPLRGTAGSTEAVILDDAELSRDGGAAIVDQLGEPKSRLKAAGFNLWLYGKGTVDQIFSVGHRFDTPIPASRVSIESSSAIPACTAETCALRLHVKNTGQLALATAGRNPMRIGLRGIAADGTLVADLGRVDFQLPLLPGHSDDLGTHIAKIPDGVMTIQACLIQEQVQWLCDRTSLGLDPSLASLDEPVDPASVKIVLSGSGPSTCPKLHGSPCHSKLIVTNAGKVTISGPGSMPLVIGYRARRPVAAGGGIVEGRIALPYPLAPGAMVTAPLRLEAGEAELDFQICVLQEHIAWLCERTDIQFDTGLQGEGK